MCLVFQQRDEVSRRSRPLHTQTILEGDEAVGEESEDRDHQQQMGRELGVMLDDLLSALRTTVHSEGPTEVRITGKLGSFL